MVSKKQLDQWRKLNKQQDRLEFFEELDIFKNKKKRSHSQHDAKLRRTKNRSRSRSFSMNRSISNGRNTPSRSSSRESGECLDKESASEDDEEVKTRRSKGSTPSKEKTSGKKRSMEETFSKMLYWENTLIHLHTISSFVVSLDLIVKVVAEAACSSFR